VIIAAWFHENPAARRIGNRKENAMSLNATPSADRVHIGIFGKRNAGKSSIINAITGQSLAIVSDVRGTTTDPVSKAMELLPLGPVVMIDTPGIDDSGELGTLRVKKSYQVLNKTDIAVLVVDGTDGVGEEEIRLIKRIHEKKIPMVIAVNKSELIDDVQKAEIKKMLSDDQPVLFVSALAQINIHELKEQIAASKPQEEKKPIVGDLIDPSDFVILVVPVDSAAPKGRLILPQQQTIRDILDHDATAVVVKENELANTLKNIGKTPRIVITDSQVFKQVDAITQKDIPLTSFSILFARYKGNLPELVKGVRMLKELRDGDRILVSEGCTHHRQCEDIGTVKLPRLVRQFSGAEPVFEFSSGIEYPENLSDYKLILHCGGCVLNEREMKYRIQCAQDAQIPITNYGISIAYMTGILERALKPFPDIAANLEG